MNNYGNEYGYHTPETTKQFAEEVLKQLKGIELQDTSWHNDECDSFVLNNKLAVYMPYDQSRWSDNLEDFGTKGDEFVLVLCDPEEGEYKWEDQVMTRGFEETIKKIDELLK